ncbi:MULTISPECIES: YqaA family protein [Kordiimonas]|jgi:membrane protein YqaA with SNARE-associated domain|uniref:Membrane protein YqaA, SNARE-associated domain n=1 Tax=Kordiimonas lacus TaxID=637679 RepID=A0A1G7DB00_9PROT|nr:MULTISPECIES: YqaA family protein [Kordiimonas]SDE48741.1 membrane protein YqaA, SNARE-associated domain [Kordiimonas lacus]
MPDLAIYAGLFLNAFVAATLLPAYSEVTFAALLAAGKGDPGLLFLAATSGNTLGAILNWWIGRGIARFRDKRWFPVKEEQFERVSRFFVKYGRWSLLLAWAPIIGDPLTVVAGTFRVPLRWFIPLVAAGKAFRYGAILFGIDALALAP